MQWRLTPLLITTALLCLIILTQPTSNVTAQDVVLWSADHEEVGEADWYRSLDAEHGGGEFNNGCAGTAPGYGIGRNPGGADASPFSLVLTMAAPCGDLLTSGTRLFRFREPEQHPDLYYKVWYYFQTAYALADPSSSWWMIMSWKSTSVLPSRNDPFFSINIFNRPNGNMFVYLYEARPYDSSGRSYGQDLVDIPIGQWFYIEALYKSRGDATGQVTIWQGDEVNRTLLWDLNGVQTRYPDQEGGSTQWAVLNNGSGTRPVPAQFAIDDAEIRTPPEP